MSDANKWQTLLRCPLKYLCGCKVSHKLFFAKDKVVLKASGEHTATSHIQDKNKQNLTVAQKAQLKISVKCAPTATGREHARNTSNFSPGKQTPRDSYAMRSAQRVVSKERRKLARKVTGGLEVNSEHGKMSLLDASMDLTMFIKRHNDQNDDFHLDMHQVVCIGAQWSGGVTFSSNSTLQLLFNLARALQSGWPMQVQTDGSFDFCDSKLGVIVFGDINWCQLPSRKISTGVMVFGAE